MITTQVRYVGNIGSVLNDYKQGGKKFEAITREIASNALATLKTRIHEKGLAADGSDIGQYSKKPIYVNPANSPSSFEPLGKGEDKKNRKTITARYANVKSRKERSKKIGVVGERVRKTRYFEDGYSEFKTFIGRNQLGKVNLSLTGGLNNGFVIIGTTKGFGLGWLNDKMYLRAQALEKKYQKPIWFLNEDEINQAVDAAKNNLDAIS